MRLLELDPGCGRDRALTLAALHRCARACEDTERQYARAAANVRTQFLQVFFQVYARQRTQFIDELTAILPGLRDEARPASPHDASFVNRGARPCAAAPYDEDVILDDVLRAEAAAERTYATIVCCRLDLPVALRAMLTTQREAIRDALRDVRAYATRPRIRR
jgi:hypothetical protein